MVILLERITVVLTQLKALESQRAVARTDSSYKQCSGFGEGDRHHTYAQLTPQWVCNSSCLLFF